MFKVAPPRQGKTIEITVERDASLVLKAPPAVTIERATRFVATKRQWVYRKLVEKDALTGPPVVKKFVEGEGVRLPRPQLPTNPRPRGNRSSPQPGPVPPPRGGGIPRCCCDASLVHPSRQQMAPKEDPSLGCPSGRAISERRSPRPRLPLGFSASADRSPTHQYPLGHPPTSSKPHRLCPSSRTRPPSRSQSHTRVLVHRRTPDAGVPVREICSCLYRQKCLAGFHSR